MNIMNRLTLRYLKKNRRRTLVTIIGVIISAAMLTAVSTLGTSFIDLLKRQTIRDEGNWHVRYDQVDQKQLQAIQKDKETEQVSITQDVGYAALKGSINEQKPYLSIQAFNKEAYDNFHVELEKGRLPRNNQEVVISASIYTNAGVAYKIGDTLKLQIGKRQAIKENDLSLKQDTSLMTDEKGIQEKLVPQKDKQYKVVGIIKWPDWVPVWAPGYPVITHLDSSQLHAGEKADAYVQVKTVDRAVYTHAEELAAQLNIQSHESHYNLLRFSGAIRDDGWNTMVYSLVGILMAIIVTGSVSLIYNAFAISVSERLRHFGMLSSIGATKKQRRNAIFFEGAAIGAISIPLGVFAGLGGLAITFKLLNPVLLQTGFVKNTLYVKPTFWAIAAACAVSMLTIFISTYIPARRASKIAAIDAIRQTEDVKKSGKTVKTPRLIRKLFGMEADIALKHMKRNKRRYRVTIFSLVISIFLFLTISYFTTSIEKSMELRDEHENYDIRIAQSSQPEGMWQRLTQSVTDIPGVTETNEMKEASFAIKIPANVVTDQFKVILKGWEHKGKYDSYVIVYGMDARNWQQAAEEAGVQPETAKEAGGQIPAILINKSVYEDDQGKHSEIRLFKGKAALPLYYEENQKEQAGKIKIAGFTEERPLGVMPGNGRAIIVLVPVQAFDSFRFKKDDETVSNTLYMKTNDPAAVQEKIESSKEVMLDMYNAALYKQQDEKIILFFSVFLYGFVSLITAISVANIFNTISTSISLRKREFGMLRSVGMTPGGFRKMIYFESFYYGFKSLFYGIPLSLLAMYAIYRVLQNEFQFPFSPSWLSLGIAVAGIFAIVGMTMMYSGSKVRKEEIVEALKQENF